MKRTLMIAWGILTMSLVFIPEVYSQTWEQRYRYPHGPSGSTAFEEINGKWYVIGTKCTGLWQSSCWESIDVVDDSSGDTLSSVVVGTDRYLADITSMEDSLICVTGWYHSGYYIAVYDLSLNKQWEDTISTSVGDFGLHTVTYHNGSIYATGGEYGTSTKRQKLLCWDVNGNRLWESVVDGESEPRGQIQVYNDTIYTLTDWYDSVYFTQLNRWTLSGVHISSDTLIINGAVYGIQWYDRHWYVVGSEYENHNGVVYKTTADGKVVWEKTFRGDDTLASMPVFSKNHGRDIEVKGDRVIVCGTVDCEPNEWGETYYGILDTAGNWVKQFSFQGNFHSFSFDIDFLSTGGIGLVGYMQDLVDSLYCSYHMVRMDADGNFDAWEPPLRLSENTTAEDHIRIYPNPLMDELFLQFKNTQNVVFEVFDETGRIYFSGRVNSGDRISTLEWKSGMYFYRLEFADRTKNGKIIKK